MATPTEPLVCAKALRAPFMAAAAATGRPPHELAALTGVSPTLLMDMAARVPHSTVVRVWNVLAELAGNDSFGVFTAQLFDGAPSDLADYMLFHAEDVRDLWRRYRRYQSLFHDANDSVDERHGDQVWFVHRFRGEAEPCRHLSEFILGMWTTRLRRMLAQTIHPLAVELRFPPPRDDARHRQLFGAPVRFSSEKNALIFPIAVLEMRLPAADPSLREQLERQLELALKQDGGEPGFLELVRGALRQNIARGELDVEVIARGLATSSRTLQRRLRDGGTNFRKMVDDARRELALEQVGRANVTVTDMAFLLGFSEISAFSRAFRRWTGVSPAEYRRAPAAR